MEDKERVYRWFEEWYDHKEQERRTLQKIEWAEAVQRRIWLAGAFLVGGGVIVVVAGVLYWGLAR